MKPEEDYKNRKKTETKPGKVTTFVIRYYNK